MKKVREKNLSETQLLREAETKQKSAIKKTF